MLDRDRMLGAAGAGIIDLGRWPSYGELVMDLDLEHRLEQVEQRLDRMAQQVDEIHHVLFRGRDELGGLPVRVAALERSQSRLWAGIGAVGTAAAGLLLQRVLGG